MSTNERPKLDWHRLPVRLWSIARVLSPETDFNTAVALHQTGHLDAQHFRWFVFFWTWGAPRFTDVENACEKQYQLVKKHGANALNRRFEKIKNLRAKLSTTLLTPHVLHADGDTTK